MKNKLRINYGLPKKVIFPLLTIITCLNAVVAQTLKPFSVQGDISHVRSFSEIRQIVFYYHEGDKSISDTIRVNGGQYFFKGKISNSQLVYIRVLGDSDKIIGGFSFYIDPAVMKVNTDSTFSDFIVEGSSSQNDYREWKNLLRPDQTRIDSLYQLRESCWALYEQTKNPKDSLAMAKFAWQAEQILRKQIETSISYAKTHLNSPIIADVVEMIWMPEYAKQQEELFYQMPLENQNSHVGKQMAAEFAVRPGHVAPDFAMPDTEGKLVRLSSFRGKYILLDFWASWCVPCRNESPYMLAAYSKFKDKGFTIFAVSQDKAEAKKEWLAAIQKDGTGLWTQTSSLTGHDNVAAIAYGNIRMIPANFLIDPQGKIVAKDLRGEALNKKLEELIH